MRFLILFVVLFLMLSLCCYVVISVITHSADKIPVSLLMGLVLAIVISTSEYHESKKDPEV